jgi:tetratricopeptide (TPR) repeat protein
LAAAPDDVEPLIWVGRRIAYLGRYREAVEHYGAAIAEHPQEARLYRHRGHRYLTLRLLAEAEADLERAAELIAGRPDEVEPDGLPNAAGIPTSTLATNVWYHLGLARYLQGDFAAAAEAYRRCLGASNHPDNRVAASYWLYLALRRAGREQEAAAVLGPIDPAMELLENHAYHRLLLVFAGRLKAEELLREARAEDGLGFATTAYGVAAWHLLSGATERGEKLLQEIVAGSEWPAFGHLAAEADLAR